MTQSLAASRLRRLKHMAIGLAAALLVLGVFGYLAGPPLVRHFVVDALSKQLRRPVSVGEININPYAMTARVADLRIGAGDDAGNETAGFDELFVNVSLASIYRAAPVIEELRLAGPRLRLVHEAPGRYNISDLLDHWLRTSDSPPPRFSVNNITVSGGRIEFDDRPVGRRHVVSDIRMALPFISNLAYQADSYTEPAFSARINGALLELTGRSKPFAEVRESELRLDLSHFELAPYLAYAPRPLPFAVTSGQIETDLTLRFRNDGKQPATLVITGRAGLRELRLTEPDGRPLVALARLDVPLAAVEPLAGRYGIGTVALDGLDMAARVAGDGSLNWLALAGRLDAGGHSPPQATATAKPVEWSLAGVLLTRAALRWNDESNQPPIAARITGLEATVGAVDHQFAAPIVVDATWSLDAPPHAAAERFAVTGARIDLASRRLDIGEFSLRGLRLAASRQADGSIAGLLPPRLKKHATAAGEAQATKVSAGDTPWVVSLARGEIAAAALRFEDKAVSPPASQGVDISRLTLANFSTAPNAAARLDLAARLNRKGVLTASGEVQAVPPAARLGLELRGLELLPLQAYFGERLNLTVTRGQVAGKGELGLGTAEDGSVGGSYRGQLAVADFHSVDKAGSADFLSWKSLHLDRIDARLSPFELAVGDVALSDFFARLIVSPEGRLNLAQIVRPDAAATGADGAAPPPPTAVPAPAEEKAPVPVRIDQVTLQGGTISVTDHFIKPNYSARVTEIGGRIAGLSSAAGTTADLDLRGAYDGAPVTIAGRLNPLAARPALDLKAEVRGVELTPLSPYSGKYAGYAIDKGKLSLFLGYRLADNRLEADNRIFLDQLTFGERVESADATKLPVQLAVALLKNRRGEIDINLPISGSLDDPEFSVGGIIVQVIVNLLTKAVTAPFALLGSLFGGGEELSRVEFAPGRAALSPAATKTLEALAKALDDRPALKLEITGRVDPEPDREGLRQAALERKVKAQKLARLVRAGHETGAVDDLAVGDEEYLPLLEAAYKAETFPKPRNIVGLAKSLPREEMEKLMLANAPAGDQELRNLASRRARAAADWLAGTGGIPRERLFLLPPKLTADGGGPKEAPLARAEFTLK